MNEPTGFNPQRRLCPDGTCTGAIGGDGRCGECGNRDTIAPGVDSVLQSTADDASLFGDGGSLLVFEDAGDSAAGVDAIGAGGFDPGRQLCTDGTCVGVIGPEGRCTVCGRPG